MGLDAFNASDLGAFIESNLGARGEAATVCELLVSAGRSVSISNDATVYRTGEDIYELIDGTWTLIDRDDQDCYGGSVQAQRQGDLSNDGTVASVANGDAAFGTYGWGGIREKSGSDWPVTLAFSNACLPLAQVRLSGDGNVLVIHNDDYSVFGISYAKIGGSWAFRHAYNSGSTNALAINGDGWIVAEASNLSNTLRIYVTDPYTTGNANPADYYFTPSGVTGAFGKSLPNPGSIFGRNQNGALDAAGSMSSSRCVLGDYAAESDDGRVWVYDLGASSGSLVATIDNPRPGEGDHFGNVVAISPDKTWIAVGTYNDGGSGAERVYVYSVSGSGATLAKTLEGNTPDDVKRFGFTLDICDARKIIIGELNTPQAYLCSF